MFEQDSEGKKAPDIISQLYFGYQIINNYCCQETSKNKDIQMTLGKIMLQNYVGTAQYCTSGSYDSAKAPTKHF